MAKLFPPYIQGTLPAFYQGNGTDTRLSVPFVMSRGVSLSQISGLSMKIKSIQSSTYLYQTKSISYTSNNAVFSIPNFIGEKKEDKAEIKQAIAEATSARDKATTQLEILNSINEQISAYKDLPETRRETATLEGMLPYYKNRIAELKYKYEITDDTTANEITQFKKKKNALISKYGATGAADDISNINIALEFYQLVSETEQKIEENQQITETSIKEKIASLVNSLSQPNQLTADAIYTFLQQGTGVNPVGTAIKTQEGIISDQAVIINTNTTKLNQFTVEDLVPGLYYKVQLAYYDTTGEIGQYSTVGVIKYTTLPNIAIEGLNNGAINTTWHDYVGTYSQDVEKGDLTERAYSYEFNFYDDEHNLIEASGSLLHNSSTDPNNYSSYDSYYFASAFAVDQVYYVQYKVTTQNGLELSTPEYAVMEKFSRDSSLEGKAKLSCTLDYDNGYIDVSLVDIEDTPTSASGSFTLARASSSTNFTRWEKIFDFSLMNEIPNVRLWRDYTVAQGESYKYSIQQFNKSQLRSSRIESEAVFADFEDMFLSDGTRQLKIRFNPKVSSFKTTILEQKVDTIGSKYPFFFRNGNVYYKEFPISGLISRLMDEEQLFYGWNNEADEPRKDSAWTAKGGSSIYSYHEEKAGAYPLTATSSSSSGRAIDSSINLKTNLTSDNIQEEREFKLEVLEWLDNGKPKIFRSPTEGNYIVRLMNSSLTPNDTLGRMLHTFQSTAYEIEDFKHSALSDLNFLQSSRTEKDPVMWKTVQFYTIDKNGQIEYKTGSDKGDYVIAENIISFIIQDCKPGEKFNVTYSDNSTSSIYIGMTGEYVMQYPTEITSFAIPAGTTSMGQITYSYRGEPYNEFDDVTQVSVTDVVCREFEVAPEAADTDAIDIIDKILNVDGKRNVKINTFNKIYYIRAFQLKEAIYDKDEDKYIIPPGKVEITYTDGGEPSVINTTNERYYYIPIRNFTSTDIENNGNTLSVKIYPNIRVQIGYQLIEQTYDGETELTEYEDYRQAINALNNYMINTAKLNENDLKNNTTNYLKLEEDLFDDIEKARNAYYKAVNKMREEKDREANENNAIKEEIAGGGVTNGD